MLIVEAAAGKDAADHLGAGRTVDQFTVTYDSTTSNGSGPATEEEGPQAARGGHLHDGRVETPSRLNATAALPAFPVGIFPDWIAGFVEALAVATQTPVDLGAMMILADLSVAAAGLFTVKVNNNWIEPVNLYLATAMPPGERKTVVVNTVAGPVQDVDRAEAEHVPAPLISEAKARQAIAEEKAKAAARAAAKAADSDQEEQARAAAAVKAAGDGRVRSSCRSNRACSPTTPPPRRSPR